MSESEQDPANRVKQARPLLWSPSPEPETTAPAAMAPPPKNRARSAPATALTLISGNANPASAEDAEAPALSINRYSPTIKELPTDERPRERLAKYGAHALSTAELIGVLIRTGNAERSAVSLGEFLLAEFGNVKGIASATLDQLASVKGLGLAKAAEIQAAIEFGHRLALFSDDDRPAIAGPQDVANLIMPELRYIKKETLKSLLLDTKNRVLGIKTVSIGDLSSSIVHPREVFKDAVTSSAASIIVAHNHPSGDPTPSREDITVTKRLMEAGEIMGIELLDHIVIGDGCFVSLKEKGLI
nr:DNA repair protein RadC [Capsulimonas corticalis]